MSIYYIEASSGIYQLDAATMIKKTLAGKATNNVVEDGNSVTDGYVNKPDIYRLEGIISDIINHGSDGRSTRSFIESLTKIKEAGEPVKFFFGDAIAPAEDCLITMLDFSQSKRNGNRGGVNSFKVSIRLQKIRYATAVSITQTRDPKYVDQYQVQETGTSAPKEAPVALTGAARIAAARRGN